MTLYTRIVDALVSGARRLGWFQARTKPSLVFREDTGELVEQREPFCMSAPGQKARLHNIRAAGLDKDRKRVN